MPSIDYLPADLRADAVRATLALVSDTHFGHRLAQMPAKLPELLRGCDLILHAGDVGDWAALDFLGEIAPVVAVQGNDDSAASFASLPLQVVIGVGGQRVFLWHSHHADPVAERNSRMGDDLPSKMQRTIDVARAAGASLAVFGHWHIPLIYDAGDLLVVNPGALASANEVSRQLQQSVAFAFITQTGAWRIVHVDLATGNPVDVTLDWNAGFLAAMHRYTESILDHSLRVQMPLFKSTIPEESLRKLREAVRLAAGPVWAGQAPPLKWQDVADAARASALFSPAEMEELQRVVDSVAVEPPLTYGEVA